ncbi:hypothetical protein FOA52_009972 [Chlamydomonas sp. UWO 241]|nr:hypothetical protein FOA52_009972 [Chlamydomonas sp. UWO 241]
MDSSLFMSRTGGLSSSGGLASPSGQHKKSKFKVLGDISAYSTKYNELTLPPPPPEQESVHNIDAETLGAPEEVWRAASMSPDGGAVIIRAYREVVNTRQQYKSQLSNIYMTRAAKTEMLSSPSRTGTLKGTEGRQLNAGDGHV